MAMLGIKHDVLKEKAEIETGFINHKTKINVETYKTKPTIFVWAVL